MNVFIGFGVFEYFEVKGSSLVALISFGNPPIPKDGVQSQSTKQFWVRMPIEKGQPSIDVDIGDYVEVFGHVKGLVKTNPVNNKQDSYPQVVAKSISKLVPIGSPKRNEIEYTNVLMINGYIKWVAPVSDADKVNPRKPIIAYVQVSSKINSDEKEGLVRASDTIPLAMYGAAKDHILKHGKSVLNNAFIMRGNVSGRVTKIARDGGKEIREDLNPIISVLSLQPGNLAPESMFIPKLG